MRTVLLGKMYVYRYIYKLNLHAQQKLWKCYMFFFPFVMCKVEQSTNNLIFVEEEEGNTEQIILSRGKQFGLNCH
jgi:hypothetical protein